MIEIAGAVVLACLASPLVHDVRGVLKRSEEQQLGVVQEARCTLLPGGVAVSVIVHEG